VRVYSLLRVRRSVEFYEYGVRYEYERVRTNNCCKAEVVLRRGHQLCESIQGSNPFVMKECQLLYVRRAAPANPVPKGPHEHVRKLTCRLVIIVKMHVTSSDCQHKSKAVSLHRGQSTSARFDVEMAAASSSAINSISVEAVSSAVQVVKGVSNHNCATAQ